MPGGDAGGDAGGESCEDDELDAVLVSVGPVESALVGAASTLEDAPFSSFCSCSSIRTFA